MDVIKPRSRALFGNETLKKKIIEKAENPKRQTKVVVREGSASKGKASLATKLATAVELAKQRLVDDGKKKVVTDEQEFREYMAYLRVSAKVDRRYPGIDAETRGLDPITHPAVGLSFYINDGTTIPIYVPFGHLDLDDNLQEGQINPEVVADELRKCVADGVKWTFHNAPFDIRVTKNTLGVLIKAVWDTSLGAKYLDEYEDHRLKVLWDKYVSKTNQASATFSDIFSGIDFAYVPYKLGGLYAAEDPLKTVELTEFQMNYLTVDGDKCKIKELEKASKFFNGVEIPLIMAVVAMEESGIRIDDVYAKYLFDKYKPIRNELRKNVTDILSTYDYSGLSQELLSKLDNPINPNSHVQMAIIFYDVLNLPVVDRRKPRGTGAAITAKWAARVTEHAALFKAFVEYKGFEKLLTTYIEKMPDLVKEKTGRLHGNFNQFGARTGRFSSDDPNLQNIPSKNKEIRKMFVPSVGSVFVGGDYSQQEPRALAHLCYTLYGDRSMMDAYLTGKDLYAWMASPIYKLEYRLCLEQETDESGKYVDAHGNHCKKGEAETYPDGKKRRDSVKEILLGLMYNRTTKTIAEKLNISEEEAQEVNDLLFGEFPGIKKVIDHFARMVREKGYVTTILGRKCRIPDYNLPKYDFVRMDNKKEKVTDTAAIKYYQEWLNSVENSPYGQYKMRERIKRDAEKNGIFIIDNTISIAEAERQILNSVVQGTGSDIIKIAMVAIHEDQQLNDWGFKLLLTVHDELIGEAPEETAIKCGERMREIMIDVIKDIIIVPMSVDVDIVDRWYGVSQTERLKAA